jgi:hypothetical protein
MNKYHPYYLNIFGGNIDDINNNFQNEIEKERIIRENSNYFIKYIKLKFFDKLIEYLEIKLERFKNIFLSDNNIPNIHNNLNNIIKYKYSRKYIIYDIEIKYYLPENDDIIIDSNGFYKHNNKKICKNCVIDISNGLNDSLYFCINCYNSEKSKLYNPIYIKYRKQYMKIVNNILNLSYLRMKIDYNKIIKCNLFNKDNNNCYIHLILENSLNGWKDKNINCLSCNNGVNYNILSECENCVRNSYYYNIVKTHIGDILFKEENLLYIIKFIKFKLKIRVIICSLLYNYKLNNKLSKNIKFTHKYGIPKELWDKVINYI